AATATIATCVVVRMRTLYLDQRQPRPELDLVVMALTSESTAKVTGGKASHGERSRRCHPYPATQLPLDL
ncbi:MAG: hypothetical protein MI806_23600, partial [Minwuiales bacterium]|nr:hypothetical protein [Minwuiales bacterium]